MKKLVEKFDALLLSAKLAAQRFAAEERGDTNFISIAIVLVVIIGIAIIFIGFANDISDSLGSSVNNLLKTLNPTNP